MKENTFKVKEENKASQGSSGSIFSRLDKKLGGGNAEDGLPVKYFPYVLFFVVIPFCCIFTWEALKFIKDKIK